MGQDAGELTAKKSKVDQRSRARTGSSRICQKRFMIRESIRNSDTKGVGHYIGFGTSNEISDQCMQISSYSSGHVLLAALASSYVL